MIAQVVDGGEFVGLKLGLPEPVVPQKVYRWVAALWGELAEWQLQRMDRMIQEWVRLKQRE